jgi:DNA-binding response OmpR family regulator
MERQYKLLIVDDESEIRDTYGNYFAKRGFIVDTAADGALGLDKLLHDEFDVAIVDIKMPKMDGIEMIRQALADDMVDASMIVLTGHGNRKDAVNALNIGADAWFDKSDDLDISELFKRVEELAEVIPLDTVKRLLAVTRETEERI